MERYVIRSRSEAPWGLPVYRLPDLGPLPNRGPQSAKGYPSSGGVLNLPIPGILVPRVLLICADGNRQSCSPILSVIPLPNSARDQASAVGVGTGSACGGVSRERRRLSLVFVDPERVVRLGLG